jgi:hypothetical protein
MKNLLIAFVLTSALVSSKAMADDAYALVPVAASETAESAPAPETLGDLAAELDAVNEDESGTGPNLSFSTHDDQTTLDVANTDLSVLYIRAVKAQRLAHIRNLRLARFSAKSGYLIAANEAFEASSRVSGLAGTSAVATIETGSNFQPVPAVTGSLVELPAETNAQVPEPSTDALFLLGAVSMIFFARGRGTKLESGPSQSAA